MDVMSIAASGLRAANTQLATTADNIANLGTQRFTAKRTDLVELSSGGVGVAAVQDTGKDIDLAKESVDLIREKALYTANAQVVKTANQMMGTLLDMFDRDHEHNHDDR